MATINDDAIRSLAHRERRLLMNALAARSPRSDRSIDVPVDDLFASMRATEDRLLRMHHTHLPVLDAAGVVEWRPAERAIAIGPRFESIRPLLANIDPERDRPSVIDGV